MHETIKELKHEIKTFNLGNSFLFCFAFQSLTSLIIMSLSMSDPLSAQSWKTFFFSFGFLSQGFSVLCVSLAARNSVDQAGLELRDPPLPVIYPILVTSNITVILKIPEGESMCIYVDKVDPNSEIW